MTRPPILVATRSAGKLRELVPLLAERGWRAVSLDEAGIPETPAEAGIEVFDSFEENAVAKAVYFAERSAEMPVLAEDSGLCVDALGGAPGVRSKRWSGSSATGQALDDANNARLLEALAAFKGIERGAAYVCVAVIARPTALDAPADVSTVLLFPEASRPEQVDLRIDWTSARGETRGWIADAPQGTNGFGYDPYFASEELGKTFGRASAEEKARVSHRARAVRAVAERWRVAWPEIGG